MAARADPAVAGSTPADTQYTHKDTHDTPVLLSQPRFLPFHIKHTYKCRKRTSVTLSLATHTYTHTHTHTRTHLNSEPRRRRAQVAPIKSAIRTRSQRRRIVRQT